MRKRTQFYLRVLCYLFVSGLALGLSLKADDILTVTDEDGRKVFVNTGENQVKGERATPPRAPAKANKTVQPTPEISNLVDQTASRLQVDPQLVHAIIKVESEYNPHAISRKGAMGLMQLIPETAQQLGVANPFNPKQNIEGGVAHLKHLLNRFGGDLPLSIAAYNAGEGAVERSGGIPAFAETQDYVRKVTGLYQSGSSQSGANAAGNKTPAALIIRFVDERGIVHYSNVE